MPKGRMIIAISPTPITTPCHAHNHASPLPRLTFTCCNFCTVSVVGMLAVAKSENWLSLYLSNNSDLHVTFYFIPQFLLARTSIIFPLSFWLADFLSWLALDRFCFLSAKLQSPHELAVSVMQLPGIRMLTRSWLCVVMSRFAVMLMLSVLLEWSVTDTTIATCISWGWLCWFV